MWHKVLCCIINLLNFPVSSRLHSANSVAHFIFNFSLTNNSCMGKNVHLIEGIMKTTTILYYETTTVSFQPNISLCVMLLNYFMLKLLSFFHLFTQESKHCSLYGNTLFMIQYWKVCKLWRHIDGSLLYFTTGISNIRRNLTPFSGSCGWVCYNANKVQVKIFTEFLITLYPWFIFNYIMDVCYTVAHNIFWLLACHVWFYVFLNVFVPYFWHAMFDLMCL